MGAVTLLVMHERPSEVVEQAANELYGLPPADFTGARDQLAKRLRRDGLREEAEAVKGLRKPNAAGWALNQLARRRPQDIKRLLATGKRLRTAQEALLSGGDPSALKRASAEERELVEKLTRDAAAVAGEAAAAAGGSLEERIRDTLHAAALDEQTAAELAAGRLVREQRAVGLFGADSVETAPARKASSGNRSAASRKVADRRRKAEGELAAARTEERKAQREHAGAAKAAERAHKRAKDAEKRAGEARKRAEEAGAALREAKRRESDAAKVYDRAARAAAAAEKKLA
jgi:hypothetical protein